MGIDFPVFMENLELFFKGKSVQKFKIPPSVKIAQQIVKNMNMLVATEVMSPLLQLPLYEKRVKKEKLMIWNPAVNQLGWPVMKMGIFAKRNGWFLGLKNGKWLGDEHKGQTTMEKTWIGLTHFAGLSDPGFDEKLILIHRGVDIQRKGEFRSLPVHEAAKRVKLATKAKLFFDPSHSFGPKLRHKIVEGTIEAIKMKLDDQNFLYDGILIEVGRSHTDTEQHITVSELEEMCHRLAEFRNLVSPEE